jgi:hypothetical protein
MRGVARECVGRESAGTGNEGAVGSELHSKLAVDTLSDAREVRSGICKLG